MAELSEIVEFLDTELNVAGIPDYPGAINGLQLANEGRVDRIVAAVDASLPVIEEAARLGPALLIVHHGMFWQGAQPVTGVFYRKLRAAMNAGLAVYSSHLPLDVHPVWGNNMLLAKAIGISGLQPFLDFKGMPIGLRGEWTGTRADLAERVAAAVSGPVHVCPGGADLIKRVGLVTGGAGSEVVKVASSGLDTFITGEGPHWSFPLAEELGVNLFYGGHYATETFGVRALAEFLASRLSLPWHFIDRPTGL